MNNKLEDITSLFPLSKSNTMSFGVQNFEPLSSNHKSPLARSTAVWMVFTIPLQFECVLACDKSFGNTRD